MMIIVDYGMGNLRSAQKGLEKAGCRAEISDNPRDIEKADTVVLPGVGAFRDCYLGLEERGMVGPLREAAAAGKPFLGICVGMQLLFEGSEEGQFDKGLGIFKGRVVRFPRTPETGLKVPHMGWNTVSPRRDCANPLFPNGQAHPYMYFVHSYYPQPEDEEAVLATCEYGVRFACAVGRNNVMGVQFHPEKSQQAGIALLRAFSEFAGERR